MLRAVTTATLAALSAAHSLPEPPAGAPVPPPAPGPWAPRIWPLPQKWSNGSTTLTVIKPAAGESFFKLAGKTCQTLDAAFERYTELSLPHPTAPAAADQASGAVHEVSVKVDSVSEIHPQIETDESYSLTISAAGEATLHSATIYGALRGLETFSQLVVFDFDRVVHTLPLAPWSITDAPRFPHRGVMIDTSRHYEPVATIKRLITSLQFAKLNVLHWHMSDSQSFPFESKSFPKLWQASYSMQERYSQSDIQAVVEFARMRGVRVMVEFDMPGHAASWCKGYPEVCPSTKCLQPLNPASPTTWKLIENGVLGECTGKEPLKGLFPENMIHLGGDEVNTNCWSETPAVAKWLQQQGLDANGGYAYFVNRSAHIALAQGRRPTQWNEVWDHFTTALPKEAIVHAWNDRSAMARATAAGYSALNSQGWYLDHLSTTWEQMYVNDPAQGVDPQHEHLVLGGQGEMWGETVDTSDIEQTIWPRLGAIAEQLWSPKSVTSCPQTKATGATEIDNTTVTEKLAQGCDAVNSAAPRLASFRCLLNRRAVRAAPLRNPGARTAPPGPGGCLDQ